MYKITILILILVVSATSYFLHEFPFSIIISVAACTVVEFAIEGIYFKKKYRFPYAAIITGIVIGSVAASNGSLALLLSASAIAMLSRSFIRLKGSNIFNPAVIGLLVALIAFRTGDDWWIAGPYTVFGVLIALTPLLVLCAYEARRLATGLSFASATLVISLALGGLTVLRSPTAIWTAIISVNYFMAFIMVSEPKTSPLKVHVQVIYGVGVAILASLMVLYKIPYPLLFPIIIGNVAYASYRMKSGSR